MSRRRSPGEGALYQRSDGRWCAELDLGTVNGKRKKRYFYGKTKKQTHDKLRVAQHQQAHGVDLSAPRTTIADFLYHWLDAVVKPHQRSNTYRNYEGVVRVHLIPAFGTIQLRALSAPSVQQFMNHLLTQRAARTVNQIHAILRKALNVAVQHRLIAYNPAQHIKTAKAEKALHQVLDAQQGRMLLDSTKDDRLAVLFRLALELGLRRGELAGLLWSDINFTAATLTVSGNVQVVKGQGIVRGTPKTQSSERTLPLAPALLTMLRAHRRHQADEQQAYGWSANGYVLTSSVGTPLHPVKLVKAFKRGLRAAGLPATIRLHDLRHSCASLLVAQNINPRVLMEYLGHANITTTMNVYAHVSLDSLQQAAAELDARLNEAPATLELPKKEIMEER